MRYIITKHYDNGKATAQIAEEPVQAGEFENFDVYCDELEDNASARDWSSDELCCDDWDKLDEIANDLEDGKCIDITKYI
ncbi:MAG: hypothetical protein LBS74_07970 [Oscillospiraceae bacterium]|jgi:hypothetical protein|nr:hypothetical protein [Oscillospiraceae bacterium]